MDMIVQFMLQKMKKARFKKLGDGTYFGTIPGFRGVWANEKTVEACRKELQEVFEDWLLFKIYEHKKIPGLKLNFGRTVTVK